MSALVLSQVGESNAANGQQPGLRSARLGDLIVSEARGRYAEMTRMGRTFSAMLGATTTGVAAGNITLASAAASTQFALWNPSGSGVNFELLSCYVGVISGTPVGGPMFHNYATASSLAGTSGINNFIGGVGSAGKYLASAAGSALTGGGALSQLRPMIYDFSAGAFASVAGGAIVKEELNGDIIIPPGQMWVPCWQAAGTSVLNAYGVTWNETPV